MGIDLLHERLVHVLVHVRSGLSRQMPVLLFILTSQRTHVKIYAEHLLSRK